MPSKNNQRRNERVLSALAAKVEGARGPVRGTCRNLSRGGMFFVGGTVPVGQAVELFFELPNLGDVQVFGDVRYHLTHAGGAGMGIRFTRLEQEHLDRIETFVRASSAPT